MEKLTRFLAQHNFPLDLPLDGKMHRFSRDGELSGWFVGYEMIAPSGRKMCVAKMGDWKAGVRHDFEEQDDNQTPLTTAELAEFKLEKKKREKEFQAEQLKVQEQTATLAQALFAKMHEPHPETLEYIARKKLASLFGARSFTTDEYAAEMKTLTGLSPEIPSGYTNVFIPARDVDGKIWTLQRVQPNGAKGFLPGGKVQGVFHLIGDFKPEGEVYLAEGFATAASLFQATGTCSVCTFHASNLLEVAKALRSRYPKLKLMMACDDDIFTVLKDGRKYNTGREKGEKAAAEMGARAYFPKFKSLDGKPTDWNDLHTREGLEEVRAQLLRLEENAPALMPIPGKLTTDKHQKVAAALVKFYGEKLIKQGSDLFSYTGTHWRILEKQHTDILKCELQILHGNQATYSQIMSSYNLFVAELPHVPEGVNLFSPPQWAANFRNGTLFVVPRGAGKYGTEFRPHAPGDWMVNVLPYDYLPGDESRNLEFEEMLDRVFHGDSDKPEKIRALSQMYGACLVPAFPHLFMLWGAPGTGKSTAIILASRLVHKDNACSVDPTEFDGFNMETMAGKLVNFDTDIEMHKPISEKQIKKIVDRLPFRIRRKGIKDIDAPIPATHIFGGNNIPKTLDGASRAQDRRWTFISFNALVAKGNYNLDYASFCFEKGPQGILNFALRGLADLLESGGHFIQPQSGKEKMEEWQLQTDPIGQFLADIKGGEVLDNTTRVMEGPTWRIKTTQLWTCFVTFHQEVYNAPPKVTRFKFFSSLKERGVTKVTIRGTEHFAGLGVFEVENTPY